MATDVEGLKQVKGFWFPETDTECSAAVFNELGKLQHLAHILKPGGTAIQAGGNVGVFPFHMAGMFSEVWTFEPDPINYRCLELNLAGISNILSFEAALGEHDDQCSMVILEDEGIQNCGAFAVKTGEGDIPVMAIDDLALDRCDLIYLDVEGFEDLALKGGYETIMAHRPVIVCENKGLNERFPAPLTAPSWEFREWLCGTFGYRLWSRLMRDDVFICSK